MIFGLAFFIVFIVLGCKHEANFLDLRYRINKHNNTPGQSLIDYSNRNNDDYHNFYIVYRVCTGIVACLIFYYKEGFAFLPAFGLSLLFSFIFMQGALYYFRNKLNSEVYEKGFWSEPSDHSTAGINTSKSKRVFAGIAALISFILIEMFN